MLIFDTLKDVCVKAEFWASLGQNAAPELLLRLGRTLCEYAGHDKEIETILLHVRASGLLRDDVSVHGLHADVPEQLRFSLPFLDAQSLAKIRTVNKLWRRESSSDALCEPLATTEWPSTGILRHTRLLGSGYVSYFARRRHLKSGDGWKFGSQVQACGLLCEDFGLIVEMNAANRPVLHTYLDLSVDPGEIDSVMARVRDNSANVHVSKEEMEELCLTLTLHRKPDNKLLRLCDHAKVDDFGMGHVVFDIDEERGLDFIPPFLEECFDEHYRRVDERYRQQNLDRWVPPSGEPWVCYGVLLEDFTWNAVSQVAMLDMGKIRINLMPRIGSGGFGWRGEAGGQALLTMWNTYGTWV